MNLPPPFPNNFVGLNHTSNPNPSFNPRFVLPPPPQSVVPFQSQLQPQPQPQFQPQPLPQPQPQTPISDLPTTLSHLKNLLDFSLSTLHSLGALLPAASPQRGGAPSISADGFSRCPFNPHHIMPPESLFLHTLHCPHPLEGARSLLDNLHYPETLKPKQELTRENSFVQPPDDPQAELCFSLDDYVVPRSNFFYQDCPSVVSSLSQDSTKPTFSLPGILLTECANSSRAPPDQLITCAETSLLLPSDLWFLKLETEKWNDFPTAYPHSVLRILYCLPKTKESDLSKWIIQNSPRFGVVIDVAMRDHILVLVKVCLKAIVREANRSYDILLQRDLTDSNGSGPLNLKTLSFECPVLVQTLTWLVSQLSILYTEANAKWFAIGMLRYLLSTTASNLLVYPLTRDVRKTTSSSEIDASTSSGAVVSDPSSEKLAEIGGNSDQVQQGVLGHIFVYQIAAAIAALHERKSLEDKILALRSRPPPAYQRLAEHAYLSKLAEEERQKRPDYKPLIENEGLPLQHSHSQGSGNQFKTKEELLAEERDYKRRRMSYRGKKLKRAPKEVMRDIIEEHMDAIKKAGGIGCFGAPHVSNTSSDFKNSGRGYSNSSGTYKGHESDKDQHQNYTKYQHSDSRSSKPINANHQKMDRWDSDNHKPDVNIEHRVKEIRSRHNSYSYSRSPSIDRSRGRSGRSDDRRSGRSDDRRSIRWKDGADEVVEDKYYRSNYAAKHDRRSPSPTHSSAGTSHRRKTDKRNVEDSEKHTHKRYKSDRSSHTSRSGIKDRYDPSRSPDLIEDEYSDRKYHRRERK